MKLYDDHFYCFGCGAHGDVTGLTAQMFGLSKHDAAKKLCADFCVSLETPHPCGVWAEPSKHPALGISDTITPDTPERCIRPMTEREKIQLAFDVLTDYCVMLKDFRTLYAPSDESASLEPRYTLIKWEDIRDTQNDNVISCVRQSNTNYVSIRDKSCSTVEDLVNKLNNAHIIYELATPTTTPLTQAEISAFRSLRTYDSTTNITISDEPEFAIDYLKNTENGQAVANIQKDLQGQINGLDIKTLTYTGTGNRTNAITFPIKPMQVLGIAQYEMESPYQDYHRSIIPFVYDSRSSTMLVQWVKNVDT